MRKEEAERKREWESEQKRLREGENEREGDRERKGRSVFSTLSAESKLNTKQTSKRNPKKTFNMPQIILPYSA